MVGFVAIDVKRGEQAELDFSDFVEVVQGAAIKSAAASEKYVEFGLSDAINMRIEVDSQSRLAVSLFSTLNDDDIPPIRLQILADREIASAALVEQRIRALRQSYAIAYLVENDRIKELTLSLTENPDVDLESVLLPETERLYILAAAPGSFWITVATKSLKAYKVAKHALALPYKEGRSALLRGRQQSTDRPERNRGRSPGLASI